MKRVAIDCVPIQAGRGGTGSGIWTYARELVRALDQVDADEKIELYVLHTPAQTAALGSFKHLRPVRCKNWGVHPLLRLCWIHLVLPVWCAVRRMDALHKLATEVPLISSARRVTTVHDFFHEVMRESHAQAPGWGARYFRWITHHCFRTSRAIITGSEARRTEIGERYPYSAAPVHVIHHGVRPPKVEPNEPYSGGLFRVLFVAKLMPYKGQLEAVRAWEVLMQRHPKEAAQMCLTLHGFANDSDYVRQLDDAIRALGIDDAVRRQPYLADASLDEIYAGAHALLFLSNYEGFGLPIIEAQVRGVPVIASELSVLREVGGAGAWYVDRKDPHAIADALAELKNNPASRTALIEAGYHNAERFTWDKAARQTLAVYGEV